MQNLSDISTINKILKAADFSFKKSLGQNFLINPQVCPQMAESACFDDNIGVIEIGPGIGVLTVELAARAKRVVAIELDDRLKPVLNRTLSSFENVEIVFGDVMKINLKNFIEEKFGGLQVVVCANLPYYITSPIIMMLLESRLPVESITVMVQKEAAERLCAKVGSRESGAVTVAVNYYAETEVLFNVDRASFMPPPNVDSAVIKLKVRKTPPVEIINEEKFFKLVKAAFAQRRKTFVNSVFASLSVNKQQLHKVLDDLLIQRTIRAENLSINQFADISNELYKQP